jgi:tetratricopeptide (TPR) repeat protein
MSERACSLGHVGAAVQAARGAEAVGLAGAPRHTRAFVLAQSGVAHAAAGNRRDALTALSTAERALEGAAHSGSEDPRPGPFDSYPRAALLYQQGQTLRALGDLQGALRAWRTSLDLRADSDCRGQMLTHCQMAGALLAAGELEESCSATGAAVDLAVALHSEQARNALKRLTRELVPYRRSAAVRHLMHRIRQTPEVLR